MAFEKLKIAIASEPVLKLPEFDKPFKVETDASDRGCVNARRSSGGLPSKAGNLMRRNSLLLFTKRISTLLAALENIIYSVGSFKSRQIILQ